MNIRTLTAQWLLLASLLIASPLLRAQTAHTGSFGDWAGGGSDSSVSDSDGDASDAENDAANDAIDMGTDVAAWGVDTVGAASEFLDNWRALSDTDDRCTLSDPGPQIPSSCGEPGSKCYTCYERATSSLNFNRRNLHRAWCITHTNLSMAKSAIGFGDSSSGIHGVAGLSWSLGGKPQIEAAMRDLRATYDRRQGDFIRAIDGNLQSLGKCEAEHFNEADWYTRFGFLYLDHLRTRYKSAEP
jgi:hypothetical protein